MTDVTKYQFKFTIPTIISIISATYILSNALFNYKTEIKSEMTQIKSTQDVNMNEVSSRLTIMENRQKRDSANWANRFQAIETKVDEIPSKMRIKVYGSTISEN